MKRVLLTVAAVSGLLCVGRVAADYCTDNGYSLADPTTKLGDVSVSAVSAVGLTDEWKETTCANFDLYKVGTGATGVDPFSKIGTWSVPSANKVRYTYVTGAVSNSWTWLFYEQTGVGFCWFLDSGATTDITAVTGTVITPSWVSCPP